VFQLPNELASLAVDLFNYLLLALRLPTLALGEPLGLSIDPFPEVFCFCSMLLVDTLFIHFQRVCGRPEREPVRLLLACLDLRFGQHQILTRAHERQVDLDIATVMQRKIPGLLMCLNMATSN
jgi:hypothetical protein